MDNVKQSPKYHDIDRELKRPELFEPTHEKHNWLPDRINPGPGKYNPPILNSIHYAVHNNDNPYYKSRPFASNLPISSEYVDKETALRPGPGTYEIDRSLNIEPAGDVDVSVFGSNAERKGWNRQQETPFLDVLLYYLFSHHMLLFLVLEHMLKLEHHFNHLKLIQMLHQLLQYHLIVMK